MTRIGILILSFLLSLQLFAQISTNPALPNENSAVTITFDATQGTAGLKDYSGDIYAHTGVITDKSTSTFRLEICDRPLEFKYSKGKAYPCFGKHLYSPKFLLISEVFMAYLPEKQLNS